jgi:nucleotide-binding universal stress UspA family protein
MSVFPTKILLATDGSEDAAEAREAADDLARRTGSELHLVHVWHDVPSPYAHAFVKRELRRQGQEILDEQVRKIEEAGGTVTEAHLRGGRTSDEVIELSEELDAGLLVVGSRGLGPVGRILMGSHSEEIVHRAHLPVLVLRSGAAVWPPSRVVIGDDYSEDAKKASELAANIAKLYEAETLLVHAYPRLLEQSSGSDAEDAKRQAEEELEERASALEDILGYEPRTVLTSENAAVAILEAARAGDGSSLVAVGSRGLGAAGRARLGSVSTKVVRAARGAVLVYPPANLSQPER